VLPSTRAVFNGSPNMVMSVVCKASVRRALRQVPDISSGVN